MNPTPDYPPIRFPAQEIHELRDELALLKAERDELREALMALLARSAFLDQSATHNGLANCDAIAQARAALTKATP